MSRMKDVKEGMGRMVVHASEDHHQDDPAGRSQKREGPVRLELELNWFEEVQISFSKICIVTDRR